MSRNVTESLVSLFPTPLLICEQVLDADLIKALTDQAALSLLQANSNNDLLSHTQMADPKNDRLFARVVENLTPSLVRLGRLMFGQDLRWNVKEAWLNVLQPGGSQYMHSHANSFASGVIYLTPQHESSRTVFLRSMGGGSFVFKNEGEGVEMNPYNADRWIMPEVAPGDMVLYPSYLIHGVPPNQGPQRMTLAFNATPNQLNSHGYQIRFDEP